MTILVLLAIFAALIINAAALTLLAKRNHQMSASFDALTAAISTLSTQVDDYVATQHSTVTDADLDALTAQVQAIGATIPAAPEPAPQG